MPDLLIIDNYDSFTYNLVHLCHQALRETNGKMASIAVYRPDEIDIEQITAQNPTAILISPGPGTPAEAEFSKSVIAHFGGTIPIFGVCLGMQAIAECQGARVIRGTPVHGKKASVFHSGVHPMLEGMGSPFQVVRYHSLQVDPESLSDTGVQPVAWTEDGILMAIESTTRPMVWGVQFHPESIGSEGGVQLMQNFYNAASRLVTESKTCSENPSFSRQ